MVETTGFSNNYEVARMAELKLAERVAALEEGYARVFEGQSRLEYIVRAPGRVELLGNHTDYNHGVTLSAAIDQSLLVGAGRNGSSTFRIYSANVSEEIITINPQSMNRSAEGSQDEWTNYAKGVIAELHARFGPANVSGCNIYIESQIPHGGGFSSSAAFELALTQAIIAASELDRNPQKPITTSTLITLAQASEAGPFVGANTGFLDQSTCALGGGVFLDFASADGTPVAMKSFNLNPAPFGLTFMVGVDIELKHNLAHVSGGYGTRVRECGLAMEHLSRLWDRPVKSLREISDLSLNSMQQAAYLNLMSELQGENYRLWQRVMHIIYENRRVMQAHDALTSADSSRFDIFGELMSASGKSALEKYDIGEGVPELDWTCTKGINTPGVIGVRNMGGGFNNTTLWLMRTADISKITEPLQEEYKQTFGDTRAAQLDFIPFSISPGVGIIKKNGAFT